MCGLCCYNSNKSVANNFLKESVDAISQSLADDETPKTSYKSFHMTCYDYVKVNGVYTAVPNNKKQGVSYVNPYDNSGAPYHSHYCTICNVSI